MDKTFHDSDVAVDKKTNVRTYRSLPTSDMKQSNTLTEITQWKYVWKNGAGINRTCDFSQLKAFATDEHIRFLISKFEQSGWAESTKVTSFKYIKKLLQYVYESQPIEARQPVEFSPETSVKYIHAAYLSMASTGMGLHGKPISAKTLGWLASNYNSICRKFGLGSIPKKFRNLATASASLDANNYTIKELRHIAFALLTDRKALLKRYQDKTHSEYQRKIAFDRLMCNATFLLVYYLGTGQTETLNLFLDEEWHCKQSGAGRITLEGLKTRGYTVETRTFTPRATCKTFFESHLTLSKAHCAELGLGVHYLIRKSNGEKPSIGNLVLYIKHLMASSPRLQGVLENNPDFRLNCNLLKSTLKQLAEQTLGRQRAITTTRNASSTYDNANYGKVSKGEARRQLAFGMSVMHQLSENPDGGAAVAITKTKEVLGMVISDDEYKLLQESQSATQQASLLKNGGFCKNAEVPEKKAFQKLMERSGLLSEDEQSKIGCGFVIKCFNCENFGVVDNPHDIWRLLSFEYRLNEAMATHQNLEHFLTNFGEVKASLTQLKARFKKAHLKAAMRQLEREIHPLWDEDSIMDIFRG